MAKTCFKAIVSFLIQKFLECLPTFSADDFKTFSMVLACIFTCYLSRYILGFLFIVFIVWLIFY